MNKSTLRAAKHLRNALATEAEKAGYDPEQIVVVEEGSRARIVWEEGPYEWTMALTGGTSIYAGELGNYGLTPEKDLQAKLEALEGHAYFEPQNHYALCAYDA